MAFTRPRVRSPSAPLVFPLIAIVGSLGSTTEPGYPPQAGGRWKCRRTECDDAPSAPLSFPLIAILESPSAAIHESRLS